MALSWVGADPIVSLEDEVREAQQIQRNYMLARDATLEAFNWTFAMKRFIPGKLTAAPEFGGLNAFDIPFDIMRVVAVYGDTVNWLLPWQGVEDEQADWVVETGQILSSREAIYCLGIRYMEDEGSYSPLFNMAFAAHLAMLVSIPLTASSSIEDKMSARFDYYLEQAQTLTAMQGRSRRLRNRSKQQARAGVRR